MCIYLFFTNNHVYSAPLIYILGYGDGMHQHFGKAALISSSSLGIPTSHFSLQITLDTTWAAFSTRLLAPVSFFNSELHPENLMSPAPWIAFLIVHPAVFLFVLTIQTWPPNARTQAVSYTRAPRQGRRCHQAICPEAGCSHLERASFVQSV